MDAFVSVPIEDRWVDVREAARISGLSRDYLYRHAKKLPFASKIGEGTLRFSVMGIHEFMRSHISAPRSNGDQS
jgi:predicted DNA-binding transcriptional regulator AlpA